MILLEEKLMELDGGRILDVATAFGDFIRLLTNSFQSYEEAIGIDTNQESLKEAQERPGTEILYNPMHAEKLMFEDNYFDTVAMRHSMHHMPDIDIVLSEMKRVLKPKGLFIIGEVFQDPKTEKPNSHRHWHHWRAKVDTLMGQTHNETLTKNEIINTVQKVELEEFEIIEHIETDPDPDTIKFMLANISDNLPKLKSLGGQDELISQGEKIQNILKTLGFAPEGTLYILGKK